MRALGFDNIGEQISQHDMDKYVKCFLQPLSPPQIQALAALFGWGLPEEDGPLGEGC
jgi:hypothetical protein